MGSILYYVILYYIILYYIILYYIILYYIILYYIILYYIILYYIILYYIILYYIILYYIILYYIMLFAALFRLRCTSYNAIFSDLARLISRKSMVLAAITRRFSQNSTPCFFRFITILSASASHNGRLFKDSF